MPSFPLLDIAIGLIFVYLLLSLVCSSLNEGLESLLRNRANDLEAGIRTLLGDQKGNWWASFLPWVNSIKNASITQEFYRHPLIRNLVRTEKRLPTYIPARSFALAVMDLAVQDGALLWGSTHNPATAALMAIPFAGDVNGIPIPAHLKAAIGALAGAAAGDARQARINIENWFNGSMERVSGWYKARTQMILFAIGVVVTVTVNADSLAIYRNLAHSKNLAAVVGAAQSAAGQAPSSANPAQQIQDAMNQLSALDIGIGWASEGGTGGDPVGRILHLLYLHGIGWLITAAAISLGAPFWFDMLNRFMTVRATVKPKESPPESAAPQAAK